MELLIYGSQPIKKQADSNRQCRPQPHRTAKTGRTNTSQVLSTNPESFSCDMKESLHNFTSLLGYMKINSNSEQRF